MERTRVLSSNVCSIGYDCDSRILEIEFKGGSVYQYRGVPESIFTQLLNAASKGSFFHLNIKDSYPCARIN